MFSFAGQRFSIRILLFGYVELDLPTPASHSPFQGTCPHSHVAYPSHKNIFPTFKNQLNLMKSVLKNQINNLTNTLLATLSLSNAKCNVFTSSKNLVSIKFWTRVEAPFSHKARILIHCYSKKFYSTGPDFPLNFADLVTFIHWPYLVKKTFKR